MASKREGKRSDVTVLLSLVYLEGKVKIEWLYGEKRELLATKVCWLLVAERERERGVGRKIMLSLYTISCSPILYYTILQPLNFQKGSSLL